MDDRTILPSSARRSRPSAIFAEFAEPADEAARAREKTADPSRGRTVGSVFASSSLLLWTEMRVSFSI